MYTKSMKHYKIFMNAKMLILTQSKNTYINVMPPFPKTARTVRPSSQIVTYLL